MSHNERRQSWWTKARSSVSRRKQRRKSEGDLNASVFVKELDTIRADDNRYIAANKYLRSEETFLELSEARAVLAYCYWWAERAQGIHQ